MLETAFTLLGTAVTWLEALALVHHRQCPVCLALLCQQTLWRGGRECFLRHRLGVGLVAVAVRAPCRLGCAAAHCSAGAPRRPVVCCWLRCGVAAVRVIVAHCHRLHGTLGRWFCDRW